MSAGPSSRFIGEFAVDLPRPRDIAEVRSEPAFHRLHSEIWSCLRDEVRKTYGLADKGAA
jgi:NitT/TauT family transport system ATP-binding protein